MVSITIEAVGFAAGALTTFCWLPQAIKILMTRDTKAISLAAQITFTIGCALWAGYGLLLDSPSIVFFNIITTLLAGSISAFKIWFA